MIIKGIAMIGFNTTGRPKIIGSLIPKIPGIIANFPSSRILLDLQTANITISNDNVLPPPP